MATVTSVVKEILLRWVQRLFGFQLRVKDWVAPGQTHHRGPPLGVLRKIDRFLIRLGKPVSHVFVRGRMTTHALARREETFGAARIRKDVVKTLARKVFHLLRGNIRQLAEEGQKIWIGGSSRSRKRTANDRLCGGYHGMAVLLRRKELDHRRLQDSVRNGIALDVLECNEC